MEKGTSIPFWSWNDKLDNKKLLEQIDWFKENHFGGFIMHARSGLRTEYLSEEWFDCIKACCQYAKKLRLEAWAYDENGWPSGFVGGKLLETPKYREHYLKISKGKYDENAFLHYDLDKDELYLTEDKNAENCLNLFNIESNSNVDVLDDEVVDEFIKNTHELYKEKLGEDFCNIQGFFTDEPQYSFNGAPIPHKIQAYFLKEYGEDPIPKLGLLYLEKKGYQKFRYRYWKACQTLMLENFAKKVYGWCENNGIKMIGHYVEERDNFSQMLFNAGIMPFYEYLHYPGIDWLCRHYMNLSAMRQMASVAAQLERKFTLSEMFAMTGWDVTPQELKNIADYQYMYGVNLMCQHLVPYSESGNRKRDHPAHFTPFNPWVGRGMGEFNEYFDSLGEWLRKGKEEVHIAVLHTIRSAYFDYRPSDSNSTKDLDYSLAGTSVLLAEKHLAFHFIDETLLEKHGSVDGANLKLGACKYDVLVFPHIYTMDKTTEKMLRQYVANGGKVCLLEGKPTWLEGEPYDYDYLESNISLDELEKNNNYHVETDTELYTAMYVVDGKKYVFALNKTDKVSHVKISADGKNFNAIYDVQTGKTSYVGEEICIKPISANIYCVCEEVKEKEEYQTVEIGNDSYEVIDFSENYLTLDYAEVSFDGKTYGEKLPVIGIFQMLLQKRYEGDVYLKSKFTLDYIPEDLKLMVENPEDLEVYVNGQKATFTESLATENNFKRAKIAEFVKLGENETVIKYHFFQKEIVYFALFGEGVGDSLRNSMVYDTNIETIYLCGNFGVYSNDFKKGTFRNVWMAENFHIGQPPKSISNTLLDGFPFFAGNIRLRTHFACKGGKTKLRFKGRFHILEGYVNDRYVGRLMFDDELDVSDYVQAGENNLEIVLYNGNRNLLGPHHQSEEEDYSVSPYSFERNGSWENGKSVDYLNRYTFVRFGLFEDEQ